MPVMSDFDISPRYDPDESKPASLPARPPRMPDVMTSIPSIQRNSTKVNAPNSLLRTVGRRDDVCGCRTGVDSASNGVLWVWSCDRSWVCCGGSPALFASDTDMDYRAFKG